MKKVRGNASRIPSVGPTQADFSVPKASSTQLRLLSLAACGVAALVSKSALAASGSWTGATDANWADANWTSSPVPGIGDTATFNGPGGLYTTINLGAGVNVSSIAFSSANAAAYTIGSGAVGSQTLQFNAGGGVVMGSTVESNQLFNAAITLGADATTQSYSLTNNSLTNSLTFAGNITGGTGGTAGTETLTVGGAGTIYFSGNLNKGGATNINLVKIGTGTFDVNPASNTGSVTGTIAVNSGTLAVDFTNAGANANLLSGVSAVTLGGGTLQIIGNATNPSSQTFGGVTAGPGLNTISVGPGAGNISNPLPTLNMGAFTQNLGSETVFNGPAYYSSATGATTVTVPSTGTITTTTLGNQNNLLWPTSRAGIATVGLYNWASVVTAPAGTHSILSSDQVSGFYVQVAAGGTAAAADTNYDLLGSATASNTTTWYTDTLRFNVPGAFTFTTNSAGSGHIGLVSGILVTPNVGANNTTIANGGAYLASADSTAGNCPIDVYQNNTAGELLINVPFYYYSTTSRATCFVQGGAGTVNLTGQGTSDGNYGSSYLDGGTTIISDNSQLGRVATNAMLYLNGGTLLGSATTLGLGTRPVTMGGNGGGFAALAGTTMTVGGQIGSATNAGTLVIGIPASSANGGNTAGLVPGTGTGTANAANYATGTVALTYANGANGNFQYSPTLITGGATLQINSQYDLGGADASSLTFNNGTLQYSTTLASGAAGTATDISAQTVILAGNATIDTNGHAITFANPIGRNGSGGFTLTDSQTSPASRGSLTLSGSNSYTGPTIVSAGKLMLASGASLASSGVTINSGASLQANGTSSTGPGVLNLSAGSRLSMVDNTIGTLTAGGLTISPGSVLSFEFTGATNDQITTTTSGGLTINGGTFNLSAGGSGGALPLTTDGTYTLINYAGSDTIAGGNNNAALNADLSVGNPAYGLTYSFRDTGSGAIQLIVTGTAANSSGWILDGSSGSWATAGNWSSSAIPNSVGSSASFSGAAATHNNLARTVTLDGNETVGNVLFDSPNGESYNISQGTSGSLILSTGTSSMATITVNAGSHQISAPVTLSSSLDITTTGAGSLLISGNVSNGTGSNTITKDGTGSLALSGTNAYGPAAGTVGTIINSGTVQIYSSGALSTGDVSITAPLNPVTLQAAAPGLTVGNNISISPGVVFTFDTQANSTILSGVISGSGSGITKIGSGTLILSGSNTYSGNTNVSAGMLQLGNGGTSGYVSGNIIDNSALVLNRTDNYALGNVISGTGTLTQSGTDNVTLNGTNTFSGNTVIAAGSLTTGNALALQKSTLNYNGQGGALSFGTLTAATIGGLTGGQNLALTNTATAPVALTFGGPGTNIYSGTLSGGGSVTMNATGTQTLSGVNTYTGTTTVSGGTLNLAGTLGTSGTPAGAITVYTGALGVSGNVSATSLTTVNTGGYSAMSMTAGNLTLTGNLAVNLDTTGSANSGLVSLGGGTLSANSVTIDRSGSNYGVTAQTLGSTGTGLYVNGATLAIATTLTLGDLSASNSSADMRMDSGSVTVGGTTIITDDNLSGRLSLLDVNGGTFTSSDTTGAGIQIGGLWANGTGELLVSGTGTLIANKITFNDANQGSGTDILELVGGTTYLGAGGIVAGNGGSNNTINFGSTAVATIPVIAASAGWSTSLNISINNSSTGSQVIFKAANASGGAETITLTGSLTGFGGLAKTGAGVLVLGGQTSYFGPTNVSAGTLVDANNDVLQYSSSVNINGSMIIQNGPGLQSITNAVAQGYNGGAWNGSGSGVVISSSAAAADTSHLHAVGVIQNDNGAGTQLYTTFEGYSSLNDSDVLLKYTWYGDTDLNGKVDGTDYSRVDYAYAYNLANPNSPLTGWFNGDFNYDGVIDGSDYTLMDNAFNQQGAAISAQVAGPSALVSGGSAVPEPTSLGLLGIGALGLLGRRNRRHGRIGRN
jgi:autotransporter-associated beta strand protein